MEKLRDRGIYTLPNGRVFVAREIMPDYYILHSPLMDERTKLVHAVDASGQIAMLNPQSISWRIEDLTDTGRTKPEAGPILEDSLQV